MIKNDQLQRIEQGFSLQGKLVFLTVQRLWTCGVHHLKTQSKKSRFEVNLAAVESCDSAGLALLIAWKKWANARAIKIGYHNPPAFLKRLAEVNQVSQVLELS